jgi:MAP3K TRAFs-binding domain
VLLELIEEQGPSSETYGILGRVYKEEWNDAKQAGESFLADGPSREGHRRLASGKADYWDHATRLELAVLAKDEPAAKRAMAGALAMVRENWEPESTVNNLRLIRNAREHRGERGGLGRDDRARAPPQSRPAPIAMSARVRQAGGVLTPDLEPSVWPISVVNSLFDQNLRRGNNR